MDLDLLILDFWMQVFAKNRTKTPKIELRQSPNRVIFWYDSSSCHEIVQKNRKTVLRQGLMVLEYQVLVVRYLRLPRRKSAGGIPYFHVSSLSPFLRSLDLSIEIFVWRSRELLLIILTNILISNVKSATQV